MTVEQIEEQIKKLQQQKKTKLKQEKEKQARIEQQKKALKRKIENRVKYILGGLVLHHPELIEQLKSEVSRDTDKKTLDTYFS